jgi:DNA-directed RNA polymerase subunit RPC12/RpoP
MANKRNKHHAAESQLSTGVLVQVCVECGKEYFYEDEQPPAHQQCEKCGNTVFRSFFDVTDGDETVADFEETTSRDLTTEDPATDVTRGDLYDLNNP